MDGTVVAQHGWALALGLLVVVWLIVAGTPGAPVEGVSRWILAGGFLLTVIGYYLLAQGPANNPVSLTAAPIVLVISYCVLIPYAVFRKKRQSESGG